MHTCTRTHRQNKRGEAGKQSPTMLSGRDLSLQKTRFPITRHSFSLSHMVRVRETERGRDLYDTLWRDTQYQTDHYLTYSIHLLFFFPSPLSPLSLHYCSRFPRRGFLSVLCFLHYERSQSFVAGLEMEDRYEGARWTGSEQHRTYTRQIAHITIL